MLILALTVPVNMKGYFQEIKNYRIYQNRKT